MQRFAGKVAIVTGGASGIGLATAIRLGSEGARVVIADVHSDISDRIHDIKAAGAPDALAVTCDVSQQKDVERTVDECFRHYNRLDVVVNNAGVMVFKPLAELEASDWLRVTGINLFGPVYFLKEAFRRMGRGGAVVNVSSIHAERTSPLVAPYAASKAAMLALTRSAALEGKKLGIRVNALEPGAVDTPLLWTNPNVKSGQEKVDPDYIGKPEEVAAAIAFLASDDASFVTGASLRVDGGRLALL